MMLRTISKTAFPMFVLGVVSMLPCSEAKAQLGTKTPLYLDDGSDCPVIDNGHAVPEIGAGSAACALSLIAGCGYLLKQRFKKKNATAAE